MEQTELKERRYVGVRETLIYGVANGGQVIGYNLVRMQLTFFPGHCIRHTRPGRVADDLLYGDLGHYERPDHGHHCRQDPYPLR